MTRHTFAQTSPSLRAVHLFSRELTMFSSLSLCYCYQRTSASHTQVKRHNSLLWDDFWLSFIFLSTKVWIIWRFVHFFPFYRRSLDEGNICHRTSVTNSLLLREREKNRRCGIIYCSWDLNLAVESSLCALQQGLEQNGKGRPSCVNSCLCIAVLFSVPICRVEVRRGGLDTVRLWACGLCSVTQVSQTVSLLLPILVGPRPSVWPLYRYRCCCQRCRCVSPV